MRKVSASTPVCSLEGCSEPHDARGYCAFHYYRWRKYGDPLGEAPAKPDTCAVESCDSAPQARGWCKTHWKRWRTHGDPLYVYVPERRTCSIDGCTERCYGQGWCKVHWTKLRTRRPCGIEGCDGPVVGRGWCSLHWHRWRNHGDPLWTPPVILCSIDGCERRNNAHGLCSLHAGRKRKYGDPLAVRRRIPNRHEAINDTDGRLIMTRPDGTQETSLFSLADLPLIIAHHWGIGGQGYVAATVRLAGKAHTVRLNRAVLGMADDDPRHADHENGDIRDNRRTNLRALTHQHNIANQAIVNYRGTSRFRNVYRARNGKWAASVKVDYVSRKLGTFDTEEEAAEAVARFRRDNGLPAGY